MLGSIHGKLRVTVIRYYIATCGVPSRLLLLYLFMDDNCIPVHLLLNRLATSAVCVLPLILCQSRCA